MTGALTWRRGVIVSIPLLVALMLGVSQLSRAGSSVTLPAVLGAGFIDGMNPCAIAILMVFVSALLAGVERGARAGEATRDRVLAGGSTYIAGMYVTYLALGLGLLGSVSLFQQTHIVGRATALLAITLGLVTLQEALVPELGERLVMPPMFHDRARRLAQRVTLPALFFAGALIGLCTVPCSGSVYLATVALLSQQETYLSGVAYLVLYNVMFVLPLILLLALSTSRPAFRRLARAQLRGRVALKSLLGVTTVAVGLLTLAVM